jgi:geranylgeranyl diphosphate synthase, type I
VFEHASSVGKSSVVQQILMSFRKVTTSDLSNPELLSIMEYVKDYWKEPYRPALISLSCKAVGGDPTAIEDAGLVLSLVVAGMAIHDDIIDKSISKHFRQKKTIFGVQGADKALLVGDLLLLKGLITALETFKNKIPAKKYLLVVEVLKKFIFEIYEGEFMEVNCRKNLEVDIDYQKQYLWKFASDAEACARIGSILGGGSEEEVEALASFARMLAFNIFLKEELQDSFNLENNLIHRIKYESLPLTITYSAKASRQAFVEIRNIIIKSRISKADCVRLICYGYETGAYDYIYGVAEDNTNKALKKISALHSSLAKKELELMISQSLAQIESIRKDTSLSTKG